MRTRRVIRPIIFTYYADDDDGDIVGLFGIGGEQVERHYNEDMTAFAYRAAARLCRPGLMPVMCGRRAVLAPSTAPDDAPAEPVGWHDAEGSAELPSANFAT